MKKYIARPGKKVTIEINRKPKSQIANRKSKMPKGLIESMRFDDYQARRLKKNLRIFDCGRLPSGADVSGFLIQPAQPSVPPDLSSISVAQYAARDTFLFDLPGETFFDKFFEITQEEADLYHLAFKSDSGEELLDADSELWTPKGVKIPAGIASGENFRFGVRYGAGVPFNRQYHLNFFGLMVFDSAFTSYKATESYDPDAPEVEFELKKGDALFLMPALCAYRGSATWFFGGQLSWLNYDIRLGLREYYLPDLTPAVDPSQMSDTHSSGDDGYINTYAAAQFHIGLDSARAWRYGDEQPYESVPPAGFLPDPPFTPSSPTTVSSDYHIGVSINASVPDGALLAIVKRASRTFYLWKD